MHIDIGKLLNGGKCIFTVPETAGFPVNEPETGCFQRLQEKGLHATLPPSLPTQRPGLETRSNLEAHQCLTHVCRSFYSRSSDLWRLCVGRLRTCRFPRFPVFQPAHSCHPFAWKRTWQLLKSRSFEMRTIKPYEVWLPPLRSSQWRSAPPSPVPHGLSITGGGK